MSELNVPVIISATRTPVGKFLGSLKGFSAPQLGSLVGARSRQASRCATRRR
jgi:acetyl-CoA acetyltransferase